MKKKGIIMGLAALACAFVGTAVACKDDASTTTTYTGFKEGYAAQIEMGNTLLLENIIDVSDGVEYTLIAQSESGETMDLSGRPTWFPKAGGKWTLTLEIKSGDNKGTYTAQINVKIPYTDMTYNTTPLSYDYGSTVTFKQLLKDLRVDAITVSSYETYVYNVRIGSNVLLEFDKEKDTEYTFVDLQPHYFTFGIETDQGQILKGLATVNVRQADAAALYYCETNDIKLHGYEQLWYRDGKLSAQMAAGSFRNYFEDEDLPYIAFKGEYTTDSYVSVDFTGKNIPQTAFFCDVISSSLYDKNNGIYISHGTVNSATPSNAERVSGDHSCLTYFGPLKMQQRHVNTGGSFGREGWSSNPHPASREGLQEDTHYRYIVGYTNPVAGTENKSGKRGSITLRMLLINLDTDEIVVDMTKTLTGNDQTGVLEEKHFKGSIVLYGNYHVTTKWDNIRLVSENVEDIYDLYSTVTFENDAPKYGIVGEKLKPTDYLDESVLAGGKLYYSYKVDQNAAETALVEFPEELTIDKAGAYRITFVPDDTSVNPRSMMLYANASLNLDFEDGVHNALQGVFRVGTYMETEKPLNGEKSAKVTVGSVLGLNWSDWGIDLAYLDRVFADPSVENVVLKMKSDADVYAPMTYQTGNNAGKAVFSSSGTVFKKDYLTFVTITRANYEKAAENNASGLYQFRFYASGSSINQFHITVDDITIGKVHPDGVFAYKEGVDTSYTFQGTVQEFYFNNKVYTPQNTGEGVVIDGNKVTISSTLLADIAGQTVQFVAKTENGMEIANQTPINSVAATILYYGENDPRNSAATVDFDVVGSVQSVKIGDEAIAFTQSANGTVSIKKADLAKFAGAEAKTLAVVSKLADDSETTFNLSFQGATTQLPTFETADEVLPFTLENMGATEIVDVSGKFLYKKSGSEYVPDSEISGSAYKITLPDLGEGLHKIVIPFEVLEEIFSQPYVDAFHFNIHLSYGKSGVYTSDGFSTVEFAKGFHSRGIDRGTYATYAATRSDYVFSLDSASHKGSVEYLYIDNIRMTCDWSTTKVVISAEEAANGITVGGFYSKVVSVHSVANSVETDVTADFTINGNTITVKEGKENNYKFITLAVRTDTGIRHLIALSVQS